jgi:hypothetical protein
MVPGNSIYGEVIVRVLSWDYQDKIKNDQGKDWDMPRYLSSDGKIDMEFLMTDFQKFWRENGDIWGGKFDYQEAAPQLILMAFLQRVVNGGGRIIREMAASSGRLDLCVEYKDRRYPVELKIRRGPKTCEKGVEQLSKYMDTLNCAEGWLLVFDRRKRLIPALKYFMKRRKLNGKRIVIVGL